MLVVTLKAGLPEGPGPGGLTSAYREGMTALTRTVLRNFRSAPAFTDHGLNEDLAHGSDWPPWREEAGVAGPGVDLGVAVVGEAGEIAFAPAVPGAIDPAEMTQWCAKQKAAGGKLSASANKKCQSGAPISCCAITWIVIGSILFALVCGYIIYRACSGGADDHSD